MRVIQPGLNKWMAVVMIALMVGVAACSKQTTQKAGQGAATGAVVGAVGGLVTGLVFGGNAAESAARGAVYGASTGAAAGAMSSAMAESSQKEADQAKQTAELENLRKKLGDDAFEGLKALMECKHEVAGGYGRTAAKSDNKDYALSGLWLQVLTYADSRQEEKARELFPQLIEKDNEISSESQAETQMRDALQELMDIRQQHNLPKLCT